jgi:hypothetical protein
MKIPQFFAKGKLTPSNAGTSAWETAGRRIGPLYEQIAHGQEALGQATAKLAEEQKYKFDALEVRGGGGGGKGGSARDALDFGKPWGGSGVVPGGGIEGPPYAYQLNQRANREISRAAAALPNLVTPLADAAGPSMAPGKTPVSFYPPGATEPTPMGAEPTPAGGVTVIRGGGTQGGQPSMTTGGDTTGGVTIIRGGQPQQTVVPSYPASLRQPNLLPVPPGGAVGVPRGAITEEPLPGSVEPPARGPTPAAAVAKYAPYTGAPSSLFPPVQTVTDSPQGGRNPDPRPPAWGPTTGTTTATVNGPPSASQIWQSIQQNTTPQGEVWQPPAAPTGEAGTERGNTDTTGNDYTGGF